MTSQPTVIKTYNLSDRMIKELTYAYAAGGDLAAHGPTAQSLVRRGLANWNGFWAELTDEGRRVAKELRRVVK